VSRGFWTNIYNHKIYFDWLHGHLGLKSMDDWYSVKIADIEANGGSLLSKYNDSLSSALAGIYPEHLWNFRTNSKGQWSNLSNQRDFFDKIAKELGLKETEDWYRVKLADLEQRGAGGILKLY
jgi:uncharacterized membrane protein YcaP (DUF421 family)